MRWLEPQTIGSGACWMIGIRAPRPGALRLYMAAAGGVATAPGIIDVHAIALGLHTNIVFLPKKYFYG